MAAPTEPATVVVDLARLVTAAFRLRDSDALTLLLRHLADAVLALEVAEGLSPPTDPAAAEPPSSDPAPMAPAADPPPRHPQLPEAA